MTPETQQSLAALQAALPRVTKDGKGQRSKYATITAVLDAVLPVVEAAGWAVLQPVTSREPRSVTVETILVAPTGDTISSGIWVLGTDGSHQDAVAGSTYARRVQLVSLLGLPLDDDDGQANRNAQDARRRRQPVREQPDDGGGEAMATQPQIRMLAVQLRERGYETSEARHRALGDLLGTDPISATQITKKQASAAIDKLESDNADG